MLEGELDHFYEQKFLGAYIVPAKGTKLSTLNKTQSLFQNHLFDGLNFALGVFLSRLDLGKKSRECNHSDMREVFAC
ncbi:hypothetical protein D3C72_1828550 [compost metagenome]